jgi:rubrerythrin
MTIVVTKATGGTAKPVGLLYIEPDRQVPDAGSGTALAETGLDATFVADLLSAVLQHERCGVHLYRSVSTRTVSDDLRQQYEHFLEETTDHVRRLEELITASGGDPQYVSPSARATEKAGAGLVETTFMLAGSVDPITAELGMLEAVLLAETKDRGNWELLEKLGAQMVESPLRDQFQATVAEVLAQEEEHYTWAHDTWALLVFALATGGEARIAGREEVIDLRAMTRDDLYAEAQAHDIAGRSQMTKSELVDAVGEQTGATR